MARSSIHVFHIFVKEIGAFELLDESFGPKEG